MPSLIILDFKEKNTQEPTENSQILKTHTFYFCFCDFWIAYSTISEWFMGRIKLFTEILENIS